MWMDVSKTQEGDVVHLRIRRRAVLLKDRKLRMMHSKKQDQIDKVCTLQNLPLY